MKKILFAMAALVLCVATSCDDNDNPKVPESAALYQQYEVDFAPSGTSAFANFRLETANGPFVKLPKGSSVTANSDDMEYINHVEYNAQNPTVPLNYDYSQAFDGQVPAISFVLTRGKTTITNVVRRNAVTNISIPNNFSSVKNNTPIQLTSSPAQGETFTARLESTGGNVYQAQRDALTNTIRFFDVPAGVYNLVFYTKKVAGLQETDKGAGGSITIYYIDTRTVNVAD